MNSSVIQSIKFSANKITPHLSDETPAVGCFSWLYRLFSPPTSQTTESNPLLAPNFQSDFIKLANGLNESKSSAHNCKLLHNFLQKHPISSLSDQRNKSLREHVKNTFEFIVYCIQFTESDIDWFQNKNDYNVLGGLKSIFQNPQFIYHCRARSLIENVKKAGLLTSPINQSFINYLNNLPKKSKPENPLSRSFDSFSYDSENFQHAQDLLRNLAASKNPQHKYFDIANGILQSMLIIANDLREEVDYPPTALPSSSY